MYNIPILFIIFRRKDVAMTSFEPIRKIKPARLYIACDGARKNIKGEEEAVQATREAILQSIDWDCDLHTLFQNENLGCSRGPYTAINWLFDNEEMGIIIEDDCVMQDSFFPFTEELLLRYADDQRIGMIDAANYQSEIAIPDSYGFSRYKSTNGWATWRRAWKLMDIDMTWRDSGYKDSILHNMGYKSKDVKYWKYRVKAIDFNDVSAWDWQWYFTLAAYNMLGIYPKCSLTTNIGFGDGATHTDNGKIPAYYHSDAEIEFPLRHPKYVVPYEPYERRSYNRKNTLYMNLMKYLPLRMKKVLKDTFNL